MRSRAVRVFLGAVAWAAIGGAAFLLTEREQSIAARRDAGREFATRAEEAVAALADARLALHAYTLQGEAAAVWAPRAEALAASARNAIDELQQAAANTEVRAALAEAAAQVGVFARADQRAREYLADDHPGMARDLVLGEGGPAAGTAARLVREGAAGERLEHAAAEAADRQQQAYAVGGAAGAAAFVVLLLAVLPSGRPSAAAAGPVESVESVDNAERTAEADRADPVGALSLREPLPRTPPSPAPAPPPRPEANAALLATAADICTAIGRAAGAADLSEALARAAGAMEASGLIVWLGDASGGPLRPVVAHGYPESALARMPAIPASADNAVALAYRTGTPRTAPASGGGPGAVVAPLIAVDGCIGALTAEVAAGREAESSVQAMCVLVAAQFALLLAPAPSASAPAGGDAVVSA
jgi:hypothetical protein